MSRLSFFPTLLICLHLFSYVSARNSYLSRTDLAVTGHKRSSSRLHKRTTSRNESVSLNRPSLSASSVIPFAQGQRKRDDTGTYLSCFYDSSSSRVLSVGPYTLSSSLTTATCVQHCEDAGYGFAGTEYGVECWCGEEVADGASAAPDSDCSQVCSGAGKLYLFVQSDFYYLLTFFVLVSVLAQETCGNDYRLSLYETASSSSSSTSSSAYTYLGCYDDSSSSRVLSSGPTTYSSLTTETCMSQCASQGLSYFGMEYGQECWCGSAISSSSSTASASDCSYACTGDCKCSARPKLYRGSSYYLAALI